MAIHCEAVDEEVGEIYAGCPHYNAYHTVEDASLIRVIAERAAMLATDQEWEDWRAQTTEKATVGS
jgi:hypothetical protein